jgi:hypothetical protein
MTCLALNCVTSVPFKGLTLTAIPAFSLPSKGAHAVKERDFVFLKEVENAFVVLLDHLILAR